MSENYEKLQIAFCQCGYYQYSALMFPPYLVLQCCLTKQYQQALEQQQNYLNSQPTLTIETSNSNNEDLPKDTNASPTMKETEQDELQKVQITNICAGFSVGSQVNMHNLIDNDKEVIYNPGKVNMAKMSFGADCKATALIFSSGRVTLTGIRKEEEVEMFAAKVVERINKAQENFRFGKVEVNKEEKLFTIQVDDFEDSPTSKKVEDLKVNSFTAKATLGFHMNMEVLADGTLFQNIYKGQFHYVKYGKNVKIFHTGKVLFQGVKSVKAAQDLLDEILPQCKDAAIDDEEVSPKAKRTRFYRKQPKLTKADGYSVNFQ